MRAEQKLTKSGHRSLNSLWEKCPEKSGVHTGEVTTRQSPTVHCKKQALDLNTFFYLFQNINNLSTYNYLKMYLYQQVISFQLFIENDISFS